jgi:tetratricopeptide (TPR) repeat protein
LTVPPLEPLTLKGKETPQEAFTLVKSGSIETRIGASVAKGLTRFVGRQNSMALLHETFDKAHSGSGQVIGLMGEAGVGKSRLLLEMRNTLPEHTLYLEGRCLHYGGSMAYLPILDILRSYFGIHEGDREYLITKKMEEKALGLVTLLPPLKELLSLPVNDETFTSLEPKKKREKTFEALRDLFIRLSEEHTLVLVIEDLHWIDHTSQEFLDYFIGWLAKSPILLILLYRPEYTHSWGSKSYYTAISLDQLGPASSSELIKAILEEGEVAPELKDLILTRAAGNPLFMEEFTHTLLENGSIGKKEKTYTLNRKPSDIHVPDTIQGIIAARMDRLEENLKKTMQVASVIGRDFAFRILQTITDMREDLKSYLLNLQGLEFIYEKRLFPELEYIFKHALIQEVAYNSLLTKRRSEIHKKIGQAIESLYPERLEEFYEMLAYHYARGEVLEKAWRYLKLSGGKATRSYAAREAYAFYKEAVEILKRLPETEESKKEKIDILFLMGHLMVTLAFPEGSLEMLQEGEKLAQELGDKRRREWFMILVADYYTVLKGEPLIGMKYAEDALKEARKNQDIVSMSHCLVPLCNACLVTGQFNKIVNVVPEIIEMIEKTKRQTEILAVALNPYSLLCGYCGVSMGCLGDFEEGKNLLEKGLRIASKINDLMVSAVVTMCYGLFFTIKGDWNAAREHLQNSLKYSEETNWLLNLALTCSFLGYACAYAGEPETGVRHAEKGLKIQRETGVQRNLSLQHYSLSHIYLELGDLEKVLDSAEEALRLSQKHNDKATEGRSRILLGRILGRTEPSNTHKADQSILKGIEILQELQMKPWYAEGYLRLGEHYLNTGKKGKALQNLKKAEGMFREMGMDYWLTRTQELLGRV